MAATFVGNCKTIRAKEVGLLLIGKASIVVRIEKLDKLKRILFCRCHVAVVSQKLQQLKMVDTATSISIDSLKRSIRHKVSY
jgi:hypothetical protein